MNNRYYSLDVFRGFTVALMILVNNPGSWSHIYAPLEHAPWHGCTPTDLVFPFFLFAVGNALSFVMPRFEQNGYSAFFKKVARRTFLILTIGLLLNWSPFIKWQDNHLVWKTWETIRIMGVLQRIALCYFFASFIIYFAKSKGSVYICCAILLSYWLACITLGAPEDPFSLNGYFGTDIDLRLLGASHLYHGEGIPFDPEGLASTAPAIVSVIAGFLAGSYIQKKGKGTGLVNMLFLAGSILILAGLGWSAFFPLNKKIWTSSYTLYTSGLATMLLGAFIFLIELKNQQNAITRFFNVFGKNPLFIFVLSGLLPRLLALIRIPDGSNAAGSTIYLSPFGWFYEHLCKPVSSNLKNGSLLYAIAMLAFYWAIAYILDQKKVYIKV